MLKKDQRRIFDCFCTSYFSADRLFCVIPCSLCRAEVLGTKFYVGKMSLLHLGLHVRCCTAAEASFAVVALDSCEPFCNVRLMVSHSVITDKTSKEKCFLLHFLPFMCLI